MNSMKVPGIRLSIQGDNQSGKTTFAHQGPLPLVSFAYELGVERALLGGKFDLFKDLKIQVHEYDPKVKADPSLWDGNDITIFKLPRTIQVDNVRMVGMRQLWNYFNERIGLVAGDPGVRSAAVDTMTLARRVKADAMLQSYQEMPKTSDRTSLIQIEYGKVNDAIRDIYTVFESVGKTLIATHHEADEYERGPYGENGQIIERKSGRRIIEGLATTHDSVDIALRFEGESSRDSFKVKATFLKSGYVPELKGTTIDNPTWDGLMTWMELKLANRIEFPKRLASAHG